MHMPSLEEARRAVIEGDGSKIKIAILDSGVEISHPALDGLKLFEDIVVSAEENKITIRSGEGKDVYGHGTAIAHIIHTLAPNAEICSVRVLGEGLRSRTEIITEGVRQAFDLGCHILNCSFGCRGEERFVFAYKQWIDEAYLLGRHIVAASNNVSLRIREWPSYFPTVIATSMAKCEQDDKFFRLTGNLIEFAAKGVNVEVPWNHSSFKTVTGSSYAAPRMAGLAARLLSVYPHLSVLAVKEILLGLAEPFEELVAADNYFR